MTRKTKFENKTRKDYNQILNKCTDDAIYTICHAELINVRINTLYR